MGDWGNHSFTGKAYEILQPPAGGLARRKFSEKMERRLITDHMFFPLQVTGQREVIHPRADLLFDRLFLKETFTLMFDI